ncbi:restriction endonuclease [Thauera sp.]|uniref:restriction endonuclease n=1 Tax=Thauera sp. TaxID=1905334 RepID=UPI002C33551D|nr:restriction endonuclease [Thauera sp.]HRO36455.1 restriction endonuclease [Thauera sp.]
MSRRKRSSLAEDLFELAAKLPWWLCFILAVISYAVLHRYAVAELPVATTPSQMGGMMTQVMTKGLASSGQYILPIILVFGGIASFLGRRRRKALAQHVADNTSGGALRTMSWQDFELLVGEAFRMRGYSVSETGGGGADGGVDLELRKGGEVFLVQCKQWRAYKVSVTVVRELYGVMAGRGAAGGFVVTSGVFTADARAFAEGRNIELIDGAVLATMIERAKTSKPASTPAVDRTRAPDPVAANPASPACPKCGSTMVRRTARQGANAGGAFWGCATFPKCRGVRAIE